MGENCGKQDAFRDGVLSGTGRRWGGGSVQTVIVPLFALSEIRSQTRQNWGYTRDAAIRPNKHCLRAEFSLFSLFLALVSMESPLQPRFVTKNEARNRRFCAF